MESEPPGKGAVEAGTGVQPASGSFGCRGGRSRVGPSPRHTPSSATAGPGSQVSGDARFSHMLSALAGGAGGPGLRLTGESTRGTASPAINPRVPGMRQALQDQGKRSEALSEEARQAVRGKTWRPLAREPDRGAPTSPARRRDSRCGRVCSPGRSVVLLAQKRGRQFHALGSGRGRDGTPSLGWTRPLCGQ